MQIVMIRMICRLISLYKTDLAKKNKIILYLNNRENLRSMLYREARKTIPVRPVSTVQWLFNMID